MDVRARNGIGGVGGFSSATAGKAQSPKVPPKRTSYDDLFDRLGREQREARLPAEDVDSTPATPSRSFTPLGLQLEGGVAGLREQPAPARARQSGGTDEVDPANIIIWAKANRVESDGKTAVAALKRTVHLNGDGLRIEMLHVSGMSPLTSVQDHQPFVGNSKVTDDAFDQSQALVTAATFYDRIASYGVNLKSVFHDPEHHDGVVRILVNGTSEDNAGYAAGANVYVFGTSDGKFHLASCKEILVHELGHGYFDHIAPGLNTDESGEGKPFHEAYGDLFAALNFGNPNISEDIAEFIAATGGPKSKALRVLANDATLDPNVTEEHTRSLVYSGMMWSVTQKLGAAIGKDKACDLMLGAVAKTPFFVTNRSPKPEDVVRAFADGIRAHITDPALQAQALESLRAEAVRRNVLPEGTKLDAPAPSAEAQAFQAGIAQVKTQPVPANALAGIARSIPEVQKHGDLAFEVVGDRTAGDVRRVTLRALAADTKTNKNVRVEDGLLEIVMVGNSVRAVQGGALTLPAFDFARREADAKSAVDKARDLTREHLKKLAPNNKGAEAVSKSFDTLFSKENLKAERVVSGGHLCISLMTMAGDFVVDLATGEVRTRRLMHVYTLD